MEKITPCLWFDNNAQEAAKFYVSVFKNSRIIESSKYGESGAQVSGQKKDSVMVVEFELNGQHFTALNGGPLFKFNEAISFVIDCKDQKEVDYYWNKLTSNGGRESQCGWLKDKFGVSWQVVPKVMNELMTSDDPARNENVMKAMLKMSKLDVKKLQQAYDGK